MFIKQLYTGCLSEAAYYIDNEGEAAIIDPPARYRCLSPVWRKERKATIKYIFETHFHADFVSGHLDLAKATGAPIIFGPNRDQFPIHLAKDGEMFQLGDSTIEVLHTPGHTIESSCYLVRTPMAIPKPCSPAILYSSAM
jgi:hydroxyacylglutathione hydrolase